MNEKEELVFKNKPLSECSREELIEVTMIDWKKAWDQFDNWLQAESNKKKTCKSCGNTECIGKIEWEDQQKAIERIFSRLKRGKKCLVLKKRK